jgi:dCMP deaminase
MTTVLILHIPVLHAGYLQIFERYAEDVDGLYVMGKTLLRQFIDYAYLQREIRAVDPHTIKKIVEALEIFFWVEVLDVEHAQTLRYDNVIIANEDITRRFAEQYFDSSRVAFVPSFLRWDTTKLARNVTLSSVCVTRDPFHQRMMALAEEKGEQSSCWWRQIGIVAVKEQNILLTAYNKAMPTEHDPYAFGHIRDLFKPGEHGELSSTLHAEKVLVATAARNGIILEGADVYLSVFPCPDCAKVLSATGIRRCYFKSGNAYLDAEKVMRGAGIEIARVL